MDDLTRDRSDIGDLLARSHQLVDEGDVDELVASVFAAEEGGATPWADFGFARWDGAIALREGYARSLARFEAAVHAMTNLRVEVDGDVARARHYVLGWHWLAERAHEGPGRGADFLVLGLMSDELVRQGPSWRILGRRLRRLGPGPAAGSFPGWLADLGG